MKQRKRISDLTSTELTQRFKALSGTTPDKKKLTLFCVFMCPRIELRGKRYYCTGFACGLRERRQYTALLAKKTGYAAASKNFRLYEANIAALTKEREVLVMAKEGFVSDIRKDADVFFELKKKWQLRQLAAAKRHLLKTAAQIDKRISAIEAEKPHITDDLLEELSKTALGKYNETLMSLNAKIATAHKEKASFKKKMDRDKKLLEMLNPVRQGGRPMKDPYKNSAFERQLKETINTVGGK